jgi:cytochrome c
MRPPRVLALLTLALAVSPALAQTSRPVNTLTDEEKAAGFRLLFDGTPTGWRSLGRPGTTGLPNGWDIDDQALHHRRNGGGGDITTDDVLENFELRFDFKIARNGNSGLKYRVIEQRGNTAAVGIEYQIVDQLSATADNKGKHAVASLYDLVEALVPEPRPAGQWNEARIIDRAGHIEHWLNGRKVAEVVYGSDAWKAAYDASKFRTNPQFAREPAGRIALQDHQDEVWFRNLRVRKLDP